MFTDMHKPFRKQRGFTLIELVVVVVIIGVLAAVAIPLYTGYIKRARTSEATARLSSIITAAKNYYQRYQQWPANFGDDGFYGDNSASEHFTYEMGAGDGFVVVARGTAQDDMTGITVTASCQNPKDEAVITISGI